MASVTHVHHRASNAIFFQRADSRDEILAYGGRGEGGGPKRVKVPFVNPIRGTQRPGSGASTIEDAGARTAYVSALTLLARPSASHLALPYLDLTYLRAQRARVIKGLTESSNCGGGIPRESRLHITRNYFRYTRTSIISPIADGFTHPRRLPFTGFW